MAPIEYDNRGRIKYNPDLHKNQGKSWSKEDLEYLINWYGKISLEELSLALERTEVTVFNKVATLKKKGIMKNTGRSRVYHRRIIKKATKNPNQSILSSTSKPLSKISV